MLECLLRRDGGKGGNLPPPSYCKRAVMSLSLHSHVPVRRFPRQLAVSSLLPTGDAQGYPRQAATGDERAYQIRQGSRTPTSSRSCL
jgi:hypothetical protein